MHNLRSQLQEWRNRLHTSNIHTAHSNFLAFWKRMHDQPLVVSYLNDVVLQHELDAGQRNEILEQVMRDAEWLEFQGNQLHEVAVLYQLHLQVISTNQNVVSFVMSTFSGNGFENMWNSFVEMMVFPITNYLNDQLDEGNSTLFLLEKYKKRTEWFTRGDLLTRFNGYTGGIKEDVFDHDLRLFLFDQGIDNPFSKVSTPSGEPDVVGLLDTKDPLVLEVKYFDGDQYRKNRIVAGFSQIVSYANDFNKNIGYLVVFNTSQIAIHIESEDNTGNFPPRVNYSNKDYYIIIVNLNFDTSASKLGKLKVEKVTKAELIAELPS